MSRHGFHEDEDWNHLASPSEFLPARTERMLRKLRPPRSSWSSSPSFLTGMYLSRTVDISLEHHDNHAWLKIISIIDIVMTSDLLLPLLHWIRSLQDFFRPLPCHLVWYILPCYCNFGKIVILYLPVCFNLYTDALLHHHYCYHQHIHSMCTLLYSLSSVHAGISFWGQTPL